MNYTESQSIIGRFEALEAENPDQVFLINENRSWSRRGICERVNVIAGQIGDSVTAGMHVGLLISESAFYTAAVLALLKLGATVIPFHPRWTAEAKKRCMEHTGTEFFLLDSHNRREAGNLNAGYFLLNQCDGIWSEPAEEERGAEERPLDEPAVMITSSGSTSAPKAVVITQRQMIARIVQEQQIFGLNGSDTVLISTPLCHALATRMILSSAYTGSTIVVMRGFTAEKWIRSVEGCGVTYTVSVPAQLAYIARFVQEHGIGEEALASLERLVSTSAYLPPSVRDDVKQIIPKSCRFYNLFASSETEFVAVADLWDERITDDTAGVPVGMAEVLIERGGVISKSGETGEIVCRGVAVFDGYYTDGRKSASIGEDGFFRTGDLGHFDDEGRLHYDGRKKDIIISGGVNIFPKDIEIEIRRLEGVSECVAYPIPDDILGEVVGVVIAADGRVDLQAVKKRCLESLSDYQQPRDIRLVDSIPWNENGKLSRRELYRKLEEADR